MALGVPRHGPAGYPPQVLLVLLGCGGHRLLRDLEPPPTPPPAGGDEVVKVGEPPPQADARGWYLRAHLLEAQGDLAGAEQAYAWAVRLDRTDPYVHIGQGRFWLRMGRIDEAIMAFRTALSRQDLPEAHYWLGEALLRSGDPAGAETEWIAALPADPEAYEPLARLRVRAGRTEEARVLLGEWRAIPLHGEEALARARLALDLGEEREAVDDLVASLGAGSAPATADLLVDVAARTCRIGTAWRWARDSGVGWRVEPEWRRIAARVAIAARDPDMLATAVAGLPRADRDALVMPAPAPDPCDPAALLAAAATATPAPALPLLEQAVDAAPLYPGARARLIEAYDGAGRHEEAMAWR
jgi:tetratricopeptide (TPR) repeat protein